MIWLLRIARLVPAVGWFANFFRFPRLRTGVRVEISNAGQFRFGESVSIGEGSRIDVAPDSLIEVCDAVSTSRSVHLASTPGAIIKIGARTTLQDGCRVYGEVVIGQRCILAPNVFISSGTHTFDAFPHLSIQIQERLAPSAPRSVRIFSDCWLGINSVILRGVTVGRGCVVGANSVVTEDLPPYSVAAGNPARIVRQRLEFLPKDRIEASNEQDDPYFYDGFQLAREDSGTEGKVAAAGEFVLALRKPGARKLRLNASGQGSLIDEHGRRLALELSPKVVEFGLSQNTDDCRFIRMRSTGSCRIFWAELL